MSRIFGLPLYFLIVIILLKSLYLLSESAYNTIVLDFGVVKNITEEMFNNLELLGHNITSIGVALLCMPICYWIISQITHRGEVFIFSSTIFSSILIYASVFFSLNILMDYIVEKNKDKRYSAYYLNVLKNGIANNVLGHSSILNFDNKEDNFSIEEKVIINNIFLLSYIDKDDIVDKIATDGMDSFLAFYMQEKHKIEFKKQNESFLKFAEDIKNLYSEYNKVQSAANKSYIKAIKKSKAEYLKFKDRVKKDYNEYKENVRKMNHDIEKDTSSLKNDKNFHSKWNDYVKYHNKGGYYAKKARENYDAYMYKKFKRGIEPKEWCEADGGDYSPLVEIADALLGKLFRVVTASSYSGCLNTYAIKKIISKTYHDEWKKKTSIPHYGINTFNEYLLNPKVKSLYVKELRKKGLKVKDSFMYKEREFGEAFRSKVKNNVYSKVGEGFKKMGLSGIKHDLKFKSFVLSSQIYNITQKKMSKYDTKSKKTILSLIANQKTENFYKKIYLPNLKKSLEKEYVLTEKQLSSEQKEKGNDSIKALYVPPLAVSLSLIFGILNAISLLSLLCGLLAVWIFKTQEDRATLYKRGVFISLLLLATILPFVVKGDNYFNNAQQVLKGNTNEYISIYSDVLTWVFLFEKYNYPVGVSIRNLLSEDALLEYGLKK